VTEEAEGAEVIEITLAAAFGYGADVVGIPEAAAGGDRLHSIEAEAGGAGWTPGAFKCVVGGDGVDAAGRADATVAGKNLIAEVAGVGAQTPLVDAVLRAEGAAAFGEDFELAPAAEGQVVGAGGESIAGGATSGEGAGNDHSSFRIERRARRRNC